MLEFIEIFEELYSINSQQIWGKDCQLLKASRGVSTAARVCSDPPYSLKILPMLGLWDAEDQQGKPNISGLGEISSEWRRERIKNELQPTPVKSSFGA